MAARFVAAAIAIAIGCRTPPPRAPSWPDAPIQLRDDGDRDMAIDRLWVMPLGPERDRARARIAEATASRIADALADEQPFVAAELLDQLTWMFQADPQAIGSGLAPHAKLFHQLRQQFAKAGALEETVQTLVVLAELEPENRAEHLGEIDEILAFADELAIAEHGLDARRAQPLQILRPAALVLPLPWLVDRYVKLLVERQLAVSRLLDQQQASMHLIRAHQDILSTSRRIASVLARAGRPAEIHRHVERIQGIGADREIAIYAEMVADQPSAEAYAELATELRTDDHAADPAGALAVSIAGLARWPDDPMLLAQAGSDARTLGRIDQAIMFYERALRGADEVDATVALRLGKLYGERISRFATNGRPHAANDAWKDVVKFTAGAARRHPHVVWQQTTALAESALGKGLATQGMVGAARGTLAKSLERAPSIDAIETLTILESQVGRYSDAQRWAETGLSLLGDQSTGDRYRRAKLERITADALRRAGKSKPAAAAYLDSLRTWASLGETKDLPRTIAAERLLDSARSLWYLGDTNGAVERVLTAVEIDPTTPAIATGAVAFLIETGRYRDALDAYHRALGEPKIGEHAKVYTSLWILAEGRRRGAPRDDLAVEYLSSRRGDLWYELLARAATGKLAFEALRAAATTGPRKGELAFYGAVLGLDPEATTPAGKKKLLEQVVAARLVFDAEYDLARLYLGSP